MITLRGCREGDIPEIRSLVRAHLKEEYDPSVLWTISSAWPRGTIIAEDFGQIVAYLLATRNNPAEARVLLFLVHPAYRGNGLGSQLITSLLNQCALDGLRSVCLEVRISNDSAIRFYTRFGFAVHAVFEGYYTDGENAYLMRRFL